MDQKKLSDIRLEHWVKYFIPNSWLAYVRLSRLDRPIGIWLILLPCISALIKSGNLYQKNYTRILIFSLGAILMRSIGCTINDIFDRKFDKHVARTILRPLATGEVKLNQAILFLIVQLFLCSLLLFFVNERTRTLAWIILPIVFFYPLCKRFTYWPQIILGICFNWGILMVWTDTQTYIPVYAFLSWFGMIFWQIGYDTIYAYVDFEDDKKLKIFSTATFFQKTGKKWIALFYCVAIILWILEGYYAGYNYLYYIGMFTIAAHLIYQILSFNPQNLSKNFYLFRSNIWVASLLFLSAFSAVTLK